MNRAAIILLIALCACSRTQPPTPSPAAVPPDDAAIGELLNPYIELLNRHSQPAFQSRETYLSAVDRTAGPRMGPGAARIVVIATKAPAAVEPVDAGAAQVEGLAAAGLAYVTSVERLHELTTEAHIYYESGAWRRDELGLGRALHEPLVAGYDSVVSADARLRAVIERENGALQSRRLQSAHKKHGRTLPFLTRRLLAVSKPVVAAANVDTVQDLNPQSMTAMLRTLRAASAELVAYVAKHPAEASAVAGLKALMRRTAAFETSAGRLLKRRRQGLQFSRTERQVIRAGSADAVEGHPARVVEEFNDLIDASNSLYFR